MAGADEMVLPEALLDVPVRVSVEIGRARMPIGHAVSLLEGTIVDLDRAPDDPVDVYVNGLRYGTGHLLLVDGDWAFRLETVGSPGELLEGLAGQGSA
jgi:flagellar motor switch protein FliN/FliY